MILPGYDGGGEWGGAAFDPTTVTMYVNASEMPWVLTMIEVEEAGPHTGRIAYATHCLYCHGLRREGDPIGVYPALTELDDEPYVRDVIQKRSRGDADVRTPRARGCRLARCLPFRS